MIAEAELNQLRTRLAQVEQREARRESEHISLIKGHASQTLARQKQQADLDETLRLQLAYFDGRIAELAGKPPSGTSPALTPEMARAVTSYAREILNSAAWPALDGDTAGLLASTLRLTTQLALALATPPVVQSTGATKPIEPPAGGGGV